MQEIDIWLSALSDDFNIDEERSRIGSDTNIIKLTHKTDSVSWINIWFNYKTGDITHAQMHTLIDQLRSSTYLNKNDILEKMKAKFRNSKLNNIL